MASFEDRLTPEQRERRRQIIEQARAAGYDPTSPSFYFYDPKAALELANISEAPKTDADPLAGVWDAAQALGSIGSGAGPAWQAGKGAISSVLPAAGKAASLGELASIPGLILGPSFSGTGEGEEPPATASAEQLGPSGLRDTFERSRGTSDEGDQGDMMAMAGGAVGLREILENPTVKAMLAKGVSLQEILTRVGLTRGAEGTPTGKIAAAMPDIPTNQIPQQGLPGFENPGGKPFEIPPKYDPGFAPGGGTPKANPPASQSRMPGLDDFNPMESEIANNLRQRGWSEDAIRGALGLKPPRQGPPMPPGMGEVHGPPMPPGMGNVHGPPMPPGMGEVHGPPMPPGMGNVHGPPMPPGMGEVHGPAVPPGFKPPAPPKPGIIDSVVGAARRNPGKALGAAAIAAALGVGAYNRSGGAKPPDAAAATPVPKPEPAPDPMAIREREASVAKTESETAQNAAMADYYRSKVQEALLALKNSNLTESEKQDRAHAYAMEEVATRNQADLDRTRITEAGANQRSADQEAGANTRADLTAGVSQRGQDVQKQGQDQDFIVRQIANGIASGKLSLDKANSLWSAHVESQKLPSSILNTVSQSIQPFLPYMRNNASDVPLGFEAGGAMEQISKIAGIKYQPPKNNRRDFDLMGEAAKYGGGPNQVNPMPAPADVYGEGVGSQQGMNIQLQESPGRVSLDQGAQAPAVQGVTDQMPPAEMSEEQKQQIWSSLR